MEQAPKKRVLRSVVKAEARPAAKKEVRKRTVRVESAKQSTRKSPPGGGVKVLKRTSIKSLDPKTVRKRRLTEPKVRTRSVRMMPTRNSNPNPAVDTREDPETVTILTGALSLRLAERAKLYRTWYETEAGGIMSAVALLFGYAFISFGVLALVALSSYQLLPQSNWLAATLCGEVNCANLQSSTPYATTTPPISPLVEFISPIVVEPQKDTSLEVNISNSSEHQVSIISLETGVRRELTLQEQPSKERYRYMIPTQGIDAGEYKVLVRAKSSQQRFAEFSSPVFIVPQTSTASSTSSDNSAAVSLAVRDEDLLITESNIDDTVLIESDLIETATVTMAATNFETTEASVVEERDSLQRRNEGAVLATSTQVDTTIRTLEIVLSPGVLEDQVKAEITSTYRYSTLEIYARAENSTQPIFLGVATATAKNWLYWIDTASLPSGVYRLIVQAKDEGNLKEVAEIEFENTSRNTMYLEQGDYTRSLEVVEQQVTEIAQSTSSPLAEFVDPRNALIPRLLESPFRAATTTTGRVPEVENVRTILSSFSDEFNSLLRRYGSAVQSGDQISLRLTESALTERIAEVALESGRQSDFRDSIYILEAGLRQEIEEVKKQIIKVETFKKERTAAASGIDTDGDGISDYDEYLLYSTDPQNPDTDSDGVVDGVEISLGYDPVNNAPEAVIRFNSPQHVEYEDVALLGIEAVNPLLVYEADEDMPSVQSEITGYGLPNSFVTLYIFSEPTVVVLKTQDDGSFSYTLAKELPDGEHEVFAALTDNTGQVVVRSSGFKFVKTAETYTHAASVPPSTSSFSQSTLNVDKKMHHTVVALGIISFGLILLLLAATIRRERVKTSFQQA